MSTPSAPKPPSPSPAALAPYARVKQHLKERLTAGEWPPGAQLPSEAELVAQFGISRMTANRALRELQADGLVERVQGVGTFAAHQLFFYDSPGLSFPPIQNCSNHG